MGLHKSYAVEQGLVIPLCIIFCSISAYQLFLSYRQKQAYSKRHIHTVLVLLPLFCLPNECDPWALSHRVPLWISRLGLDLALLCSGSSLSLMILSHFQAHYATIHKEVPSYLKYSLTASVGVWFVALVIADTCVYHYGMISLKLLATWGSVQYLAVLVVTDSLGFFFIYRLMIEMKSKKEMPKKCESENTFALLLRKMKQFHGIFLLGSGSMFIYYFFSATKQSITGAKIDGPGSPEEYNLTGMLPAVLAGWILMTWWAWIPYDKETPPESRDKSSSNGTVLHSRVGKSLDIGKTQTFTLHQEGKTPRPNQQGDAQSQTRTEDSQIIEVSQLQGGGGKDGDPEEARSLLEQSSPTTQPPHSSSMGGEGGGLEMVTLSPSVRTHSPEPSMASDIGESSRINTEQEDGEDSGTPSPSKNNNVNKKIFNPYVFPVREGEDENETESEK